MFWYVVQCELDLNQDTLAEIITNYESISCSMKYNRIESAVQKIKELKSNNGNHEIVYWIEEGNNG